MQVILGISAYFHDSAAAIIIDGKVVAAAQEERFTRIKNDPSFPIKACAFCLQKANLSIDHVDYVVYYEKPFLKFERLIETYINAAPRGLKSFITSMPLWLKDKLHLKTNIRRELLSLSSSEPKFELLFSEHHLSHAASSYFASPFSRAAILTVDGVGEWATTSIFKANGTRIELLQEQNFPDSLGLLYSSFTYFLGFKVNSGEYKIMGLAPYGNKDSAETKCFINLIKTNIVAINTNGSIKLNQSFFSYTYALKMIRTKKWEKLFGINKREPESEIHQCHCNLAYAIQNVTEEIMIKLAIHTKEVTGECKLCLSGGVALNCVANSKLLSLGIFDEIYIQPASGDAGGALGAAWIGYFLINPQLNKSTTDEMQGCLLGPEFSTDYIRKVLEQNKIKFQYFETLDAITEIIATYLSNGKIIGWFQGAMEFGPRALGNRSIIADPRQLNAQYIINSKIKYREIFRPFAPAIIDKDLNNYFDINSQSPYMLFVAQVKNCHPLPDKYNTMSIQEKIITKRSSLQSITHVDLSARIQTVSSSTNPLFYKLLTSFKKVSGCSVLLNTSFNLRGEPLVCTPDDAIKTFHSSELDILVINNFIIVK